MSNNQKKFLTMTAVALAVIVVDKMLGISDKAGNKLGNRHNSCSPRTRG